MRPSEQFAAMHESENGPKRRSRNVCSRAAVGGQADVSADGSLCFHQVHARSAHRRIMRTRPSRAPLLGACGSSPSPSPLMGRLDKGGLGASRPGPQGPCCRLRGRDRLGWSAARVQDARLTRIVSSASSLFWSPLIAMWSRLRAAKRSVIPTAKRIAECD